MLCWWKTKQAAGERGDEAGQREGGELGPDEVDAVGLRGPLVLADGDAAPGRCGCVRSDRTDSSTSPRTTRHEVVERVLRLEVELAEQHRPLDAPGGHVPREELLC